MIGFLLGDSVIAYQFFYVLIFVIMFGIFLLERDLGGVMTGLTSALLWTFYLPATYLETMITGDLLATLFATFGFLKFVHTVRKGWWRDWLLFGSLFALAVLSRSAILILVGMLVRAILCLSLSKDRQANFVPIDWFRKAFVTGWCLVVH